MLDALTTPIYQKTVRRHVLIEAIRKHGLLLHFFLSQNFLNFRARGNKRPLEREGIKNTHNFFWGPEFARHNRHGSIRQCPCITSLSYFSDKKCHCSHSRPWTLETAFPYCINVAYRHATMGCHSGNPSTIRKANNTNYFETPACELPQLLSGLTTKNNGMV
jgi:hypothetical protein